MEKLLDLKRELEKDLKQITEHILKPFGDGFKITQPSANDFYYGFWPDDWFFPTISSDALLSDEDARRLFKFLTENIVDLPVFPDRIEPSGHCVFQPGLEDSPHGRLMPVHLPAAWFRVVKYLYERTGDEALKNRWLGISQRSVNQLVFKGGLPFVSDAEPQVAFAFFDTVGISGNDLMCSVVLEKGFREANELFGGQFGKDCLEKAKSIRENIFKLKTEDGYYTSDTLGCKQFSPWANGLLYGTDYITDKEKEGIRKYAYAHRDELIKYGMVKHVLGFWNKMNPIWTGGEGIYMNGGYWPVGTAYALKMFYDEDKQFALELLQEMVDNMRKTDFPEWTDDKCERFGAKKFVMSIALPLSAINAILEGKNLIDKF